MFKRLLLVMRTVRHLKAIQVAYRLKYLALGKLARVVKPRVPAAELAACGIRPRVAFPSYFPVWDGGDNFTFLNETHALKTAADWNAPDVKKLWLYNLHYFDCLRDGQTGPDAEARKLALVDRWIRENPPVGGNGWEPYPISLRVVNWIKWTMGEGEKLKLRVEVEERIRRSIVQQVGWLERRLEYHLLANHLLANAKALVFAGVYFGGAGGGQGGGQGTDRPTGDARNVGAGARWYEKGMAIYRKELPEQVLDDGVHFELSAMYHSIILEDLLDCYNLTGDALFKTYAERMLAALAFLTGPDGKIVKFNDAAEGIALSPAELAAYAARLGLAAVKGEGPRTSGLVRQEAGEYVMLAKCGAIGPEYQPGHAHADTFTFELWRGGEKIVADTGTDRYVVDDERRRQRGTAAHNTIRIDGRDSSEVWAGHRVGRRFDPRTHRRTFELCAEGLKGHDTLSGRGRHEIELRFHAPGAVRFDVDVRAAGVTFVRSDEDARICEAFGRQVPGHCVCYRAQATFPVEVDWRIW